MYKRQLLQNALATESNVSIRLEIVRSLRHIVFQRFPGYPQALRAVGRAADDQFEKDQLVRLRASEALWEAAKKDLLNPVPFLDRNLQDPSQRLRLSAVQMLRKLGAGAVAQEAKPAAEGVPIAGVRDRLAAAERQLEKKNATSAEKDEARAQKDEELARLRVGNRDSTGAESKWSRTSNFPSSGRRTDGTCSSSSRSSNGWPRAQREEASSWTKNGST